MCLVKLEQWDKVRRWPPAGLTTQLVAFTQGLASPAVLYERLYALYRLHKYPLCLAGLGKAPKTPRFLSLRAQVVRSLPRLRLLICCAASFTKWSATRTL